MRTVEEIMAEIESVSAETRPSACTEESFEKWRAWKRRGLKAELLDALTSCIPLDRLREMCEAEREQRCVVLPCKVGDTVYTVEENLFACDDCLHGGEGFDGRNDCKHDGPCPFVIKERICEGFNVGGGDGVAVLSEPGEWGYEGLERFIGRDGKCHFSRSDADAALQSTRD